MRLAVIVALAALVAGCTDVHYPPTAPTPTAAAPLVVRDLVEYRVSGTPATVLIRFSSADDGLSQTTSTLPYALTFRTDRAPVFLSLEATPITGSFAPYPFLSVQIFVNGSLFRESSTNTSSTVTVSGTWRR